MESSIPVLPSFNQLKNQALNDSNDKKLPIETKITEKINNLNYSELSVDNLKIIINEYAQLRKIEDKMMEFAILFDNNFSVINHQITLQLDNELEGTQLNQFKPKLQEFLKSKTGNIYQIDYLIEVKNNKKTLYSASDKYNYIKEFVPEIEELKRRLGLELEH
ncbi:MAG: hypothetical protein EAZ27_10665 [Cytophagales bacterium]|nr:MAG: hypothetical protein EAZ27_10665 [Cytophagales bacterium]